MKRIIAMMILFAIVSGCATRPKETKPTVDQLVLAGERMLERMITDRSFLDSYPQMKARAKERGDALPVIVVESVVGNASIGISNNALAPVRDRFRIALRKTGRFSVKDEALRGAVDYGLFGNLMTSDETHHYLRLQLVDYTDDFKEIWNESERVGAE